MAVFLLDSTIIIDAINGKKTRARFLDGLLVEGNLLACCSINVTEVYAGMRSHEARVTEEFLRSLKFYEVNWEIARLAGELQSEWRKKGHSLSLPDVTMAAVAMSHGIALLTDNRKHFPMPKVALYPLPG
jgi:predicted nucleic acid-binding protein